MATAVELDAAAAPPPPIGLIHEVLRTRFGGCWPPADEDCDRRWLCDVSVPAVVGAGVGLVDADDDADVGVEDVGELALTLDGATTAAAAVVVDRLLGGGLRLVSVPSLDDEHEADAGETAAEATVGGSNCSGIGCVSDEVTAA